VDSRDLLKGCAATGQVAGEASILDEKPVGVGEDMVKLTAFKLSMAPRAKGEGSWSDFRLIDDHVLNHDGLPFNGKEKVPLSMIIKTRAPFYLWSDYLWKKPRGKEETDAIKEYMKKRRQAYEESKLVEALTALRKKKKK
jgi:hypothetical protein